MPSLIGVELARIGTWNLAVGGEQTFVIEDFQDAIAATAEFGSPGIRAGHSDPRFDGEPSLGLVQNMRIMGDRLVGDLVDLPEWLTPRIRASFPRRSIDGWRSVTGPSGREYRLVLDNVALLGVTPPAMAGLSDLRAAVAAGAQRIAAASGEMELTDEEHEPTSEPTSATSTDRRAIVFASRAASREGVDMPDLAGVREQLGLAADAPDADVVRQALERGIALPPGEYTISGPITITEQTTSGGSSSGAGTGQSTTGDGGVGATPPPSPTTPVVTPPEGVVIPEGTVLVDAGQWQQVQEGVAAGRRAAETLARQAEDGFIQRVRASGRLGPSTNPHSARLEASLRREWQRNQGEAEAVAAGLAVVVPTNAIGHDATGEANATGDWDTFLRAQSPQVAEVRAERDRKNGGR